MNVKERIKTLDLLGKRLTNYDFSEIIEKAKNKNPWFTTENIKLSLNAVISEFLTEKKLNDWIGHYSLPQLVQPKKIGLVLAGNIPMVGFHDILCVFICGHISMIKFSDKDDVLIPALLELMFGIHPETKTYFQRVDSLKDYQAVIATGSNNTSKYFHYYFKDVPHIIRKNRNGIAILDGKETKEELQLLCHDIFYYFGLGCRNVSKLYIPENYDFQPLLTAFDEWKNISYHHKYKNNLEYNQALYLLNLSPFMEHDTILLMESENISSRVGCLHYEYYHDMVSLENKLTAISDQIQCIVGKPLEGSIVHRIGFGNTQNPSLSDYADGIDTVDFLINV
ncbi:MAG: acyl-CoA reductase [Saprospiraceae bacterium]|nr:acyl-CoA reductase [Saprospiraceae bacterium]